MRTRIADAIALAILLLIAWGGVVLCTADAALESEVACNRKAIDALAGGRSADEVVVEHAECLRGVRP